MNELHWGFSPASRKAHLFRVDDTPTDGYNGSNGMSLCGKIGFAIGVPLNVEAASFGETRGADDCAVCWRRGKAEGTA